MINYIKRIGKYPIKKHVLICFSILFLSGSFSVFAKENHNEFILSEARLINSEDRSEIEKLAPDIVEYANLFEEENIKATESDIDFSKTYSVYIDEDIFNKLPITRQDLEALIKEAKKVWAVPVYVKESTVIVQVSKALELSEIDQTNLSPEELEEAKARAGKWQVVASTLYEEIIDPEQELREIFKSNNISEEETDCVLFGGVPGIQSVIAVLLEGDVVTFATSLQRSIDVEEGLDTEGIAENNSLSVNKVYPIEEFAETVNLIRARSDNDISDSTSGTQISDEQNETSIIYFIIGGIALVIIVSLIWRTSRRKEL